MSQEDPAVGDWKFQIAVKPRLTMFERVGKSGAIVWGRWFDPARGKSGAPVTKTTGISIRYPEGHAREGKIWPAREQEAMKLAHAWHEALVSGREPGQSPTNRRDASQDQDSRDRTVRAGFQLYLDLEKGRYPNAADPARGDVARAGEDAIAALGEDAKWSELIPIDAAQAIWRYVQKRFKRAAAAEVAQVANRKRNRLRKDHGTEIVNDGAVWAKRTVQHFFACANWLSSRGHTPKGACARPEKWLSEFKADWLKLTGRDLDAETEGLRFSPEEAGRLLDSVTDARVNPRLRLNIYLGGDSLRAGQVSRAMRSHLDLGPVGEFGLGRLRVHGRGKKKGSTVDLDRLVRNQIDYEMRAGYLRDLEAAFQAGEVKDYALMPQGRFVKGVTPVRANRKYLEPIGKRTLLDYFHALEEIAGVDHVPNRGWYGLRRLWTDLSDEHVKSTRGREILSGHARGSKVPEQVYRTKQDEAAIREAARGRSLIREALLNGTVSDMSALRSEAVRVINGTPDLELLRAVLELLGADDPTAKSDEDGHAAAA